MRLMSAFLRPGIGHTGAGTWIAGMFRCAAETKQGVPPPAMAGPGSPFAARGETRLDLLGDIHRLTSGLLRGLIVDGALPADLDLGRFSVRVPGAGGPRAGPRGDILVDAALVYAREAAVGPGRPTLVEALADGLTASPGVAAVAVAGAGLRRRHAPSGADPRRSCGRSARRRTAGHPRARRQFGPGHGPHRGPGRRCPDLRSGWRGPRSWRRSGPRSPRPPGATVPKPHGSRPSVRSWSVIAGSAARRGRERGSGRDPGGQLPLRGRVAPERRRPRARPVGPRRTGRAPTRPSGSPTPTPASARSCAAARRPCPGSTFRRRPWPRPTCRG